MDGLAIKEPRRSRRLGIIEDPVAFFAAEKRRILDKIGDISGIRVTMNHLLVALWDPQQGLSFKGGSLIYTDQTLDEDVYQAKVGLVLKMGVQAYDPQPGSALVFYPEDKCEVGDWVVFRQGEGWPMQVWMHHCYFIEGERGIKLVVDRPDAVY